MAYPALIGYVGQQVSKSFVSIAAANAAKRLYFAAPKASPCIATSRLRWVFGVTSVVLPAACEIFLKQHFLSSLASCRDGHFEEHTYTHHQSRRDYYKVWATLLLNFG